MDLGALELQPVYHPLAQVVYCASRHHVSHVWVAGRALLEHGALVDIDQPALKARVREWGARIGGGA